MAVPFRWQADQFESLLASCKADEATPFILRHLPREGRVLEAGCGLGRFLAYLEKQGFRDVVGIEVSEETVRIVNKIAPELDIRCGDVSHLPFDDCSIRGLVSLGVLEHMQEGPSKALREMYRVMAPGGHAIVTVPYLNWIRRLKNATLAYHIGGLARRISKARRISDGQLHNDHTTFGRNVVRTSISRLKEGTPRVPVGSCSRSQTRMP